MTDQPAIEAHGLTRAYRTLAVLDGVSFEVPNPVSTALVLGVAFLIGFRPHASACAPAGGGPARDDGPVSIIFVPYHLDEFLPELNVPLPAGHELVTVVEELPGDDIWARLAALYAPVAGVVADQAARGEVPAVVSGDCTTSLATVAGLQRAGVDAGIVWFDAHGDVQTVETTASGYIGGMPLRILLGYRPELIGEPLGLRPLRLEQALLVDARDLDPPEVEYLATAGIGPVAVADLTAERLPAGPLVLHLDLDVLDAAELPGLRYPVSGGPGVAALLAAVQLVRDTGRVAAVDVACTWYPGQPDTGGRRAALLRELVG